VLKVLIVDDEVLTRTNIKTLINWQEKGYEICGEAVNGLNAIELIQTTEIDIVITDMKMPVLDGIGLIEFISKGYPYIKVVALSGYEDFDYVKKSMKNGAIDYILKHKLDSETLIKALETAKIDIVNVKEEFNKKQEIEQQINSAKTVLKHKFIMQLISGEMLSRDLIKQSIELMGLGLNIGNIIVVCVEIDDYFLIEEGYSIKDKNRIIKAFEDISEQILNECGKSIIEYINNGKFVVIFSFQNICSEMAIYNEVNTAIQRIKTSIKRYLNITACFGISNLCSNIQDISKHFNEAEMILKDKFYKGKDKVLNQSNFKATKENFFALSLTDEKDIIMFTKSIDRENLNNRINEIFNKIILNNISYKSTQMIAAELISIVNKIVRESGIDISKIYNNNDIPYSKLQKYNTAMDIKQWIISIYENLIKSIEELKIQPVYSSYTKKTIEFINANYFKNISLTDAANYIGVNSSYLSRIFKEDCKKGFVEYVNSVRVEKAKLLIENGDIKLKDIVNKVGFSSYNYFFKVFKDLIGMTPIEYENSCMN
jgi:Response regulator containing CheY-like receiver domain and AraC-type DNA-binding domain